MVTHGHTARNRVIPVSAWHGSDPSCHGLELAYKLGIRYERRRRLLRKRQ